MKRRYVLATVMGGVGVFAGCLSDDEPDDENDESDDDSIDEPDDNSDAPTPGEITYSIDSAAAEIEWGEEYSVTVTARAGPDAPIGVTVIEYQPEGETRWSALVPTRSSWNIEGGESMTKTHDIEPPASGEITFRLRDELTGTIADEWGLLVNPPRAVLGETISYYNGLNLTTEVQVTDAMEFMLVDRREQVELGVYPVRPKDGQWVVVTVTAENTNVGTNVGMPGRGDINALADRVPLDQPRLTGNNVGDAVRFDYQVADETAEVREGWFEPRQEVGFYDPPRELNPEARFEGWILFEAYADTSVEDITAGVNHRDVWATWG